MMDVKTTDVKKGDLIKVEYTGRFDDGKVFDTSEGREPLEFKVGAGTVVPGFDSAFEGMKINEEKEITLKPEEGYGEVRAELIQKVPREKLPKDQEPEPGMMLAVQTPQGQQIPATITEVTDKDVTVDMNHPLAGKTLNFKIKVVGINEPSEHKHDEGHHCDTC